MNRQSESSLVSRVLPLLTPAGVAYMLLLLSPTFDWRQRLLAAWCASAGFFLAHAVFAFGRPAPRGARGRRRFSSARSCCFRLS